jgi:1-deoxy-D-xylulose-5-phosphate reductoisomerase
LGIPITGIAARRSSEELIRVASEWPDAAVVATAPDHPDDLVAHLGSRLRVGPEALVEMAATPGHVILNGIVGAEGLAPSVAAVTAGNRLALANKESLVAGGRVLLDAAAANGGEITPVDSEHSALWQCLVGEKDATVARLVLTASGGPFRGATRDQLEDVTVEQALAHPTWRMGARISIDSATMMNKALEVIEAHLLFDVPYEHIDVLVHPQSIVHSMVEFVDGSVKAQLGEPDMRVPIQYAITAPSRISAPVAPLDLAGRSLTFEPVDTVAFPCLRLGFEAGMRGGVAPIVLNAADEVAVAAFLAGRIRFLDIAEIVGRALNATEDDAPTSVDDVLAADGAARALAAELIDRRP